MSADRLREALQPLSIEEYPAGTVLRVEDMNPVHRAFAEAEHEGCPEEPPGHPLSAHAPWSGGDLDGVETWDSFMARLARHGLTLALAEPGAGGGHQPGDPHKYVIRCVVCGHLGVVRLSVDPQTVEP